MQSFVVWSDEIEGRLDPYYLKNIKIIKTAKTKYQLSKFKDLLKEPPQYGANEQAVDGNPKFDVRYIRITDINDFGNLKSDDWKTAKNVDEKYLLVENDILFARSGATAGKTFLYKKEYGKAIFAGYLIRFKIEETKANPLYIFYFTQLDRYAFWVKSIQRPSGQPNINSKEFKSFEIPLPPLSIQNQIVEIMQLAYNQKKQKEAEAQRLLDSIDSYVLDELGIKLPEIKIKKCFLVWNNEVVQRLDPLYYSKDVFSFLKEFSYDVKLLEGITYYLKTGFAAGNSQQEAVNEGIIQIRPTNIDDIGLLRFDKNIYLKKEYLDKKNDDLLQKGEVLFNNTNSQELVGKTSFFDLEGQYFCSNHITRIKVNEDFVSPTYLWIILNIYQKAKIFFNLCTNWNNQSGVNIELLKTVLIPLPPLKIQNKIAEEVKRRISEAERLKAEASKIIEEAKKQVEGMILGD